MPPGSYVIGVLSSTMSLPASLAAEVDAVASNRTARFALSSQVSGARVETGEGLRLDDIVLQRLGPAPTISPDGRILGYATTLYPGTSNAADATIVTIGSGESRTGVDMPIRFSPTTRVSGVVTGSDGPIKNLGIRLLPPNGADTTDYEPWGLRPP